MKPIGRRWVKVSRFVGKTVGPIWGRVVSLFVTSEKVAEKLIDLMGDSIENIDARMLQKTRIVKSNEYLFIKFLSTINKAKQQIDKRHTNIIRQIERDRDVEIENCKYKAKRETHDYISRIKRTTKPGRGFFERRDLANERLRNINFNRYEEKMLNRLLGNSLLLKEIDIRYDNENLLYDKINRYYNLLFLTMDRRMLQAVSGKKLPQIEHK